MCKPKYPNEKSLSLCYEAILPGLGIRNYTISLIFIILQLTATYIYITPNIIDYSKKLYITLSLLYLLNFIIRFLKTSKVNNRAKEIALSIFLPGLDLLFYRSKVTGIFIMTIFLFSSYINSLLPMFLSIIYLLFYKKVSEFKNLTITLIMFFLFIDIPIAYFETIKNKDTIITTGSMEPTLKVGQRYFMRYTDNIKTGDVGIFINSNVYFTAFTKRIVAMEGDRIKLKNNTLYINDTKVDNIKYTPRGSLIDNKTIIVPKGKVYVLGDNTDNSYDSRDFGVIDKKYLSGKIIKGLGSKNIWIDKWDINSLTK